MGVLGLAPFLQKACPDVFKILPERFTGLTGKTVVFDGTLITMRFHFAPAPQTYRHILGWYRMLQELKECGVSAVCVFDGKQRSLAKQLELDRRRDARMLAISRGQLELERSNRLAMLSTVMKTWTQLNSQEREAAAQAFRQVVRGQKTVAPSPSNATGTLHAPPPKETISNLSRREAHNHDRYVQTHDNISPEELVDSSRYIGVSVSASEYTEADIASTVPSRPPIRPQSLEDLSKRFEALVTEDDPVSDLIEDLESESESASLPQLAEDVVEQPSVDETNALEERFKSSEAPVTESDPVPDQIEDLESGSESAPLAQPAEVGSEQPSVDEANALEDWPNSSEAPVTESDPVPDQIEDLESKSESTPLAQPAEVGSEQPSVDETKALEEWPNSSEAPVIESDPVPDQIEDLESKLESTPLAQPAEVGSEQPSVDETKAFEELSKNTEVPVVTESDPVSDLIKDLESESVSLAQPAEDAAEQPSVDEMNYVLANLYAGYKASQAQLQSLSSRSAPSQLGNDDEVDANTEYIMSKAQAQLTLQEGTFWAQLEDPTVLQDVVKGEADDLLQSSMHLSDSYARRTNPPTTRTYSECKDIIRAMGVPCVETDGPFEAEALAASIVLHGQADFVGSEDTDVLVYGAPLMRNVAKSTDPLVVLDGSDVRTALQLDDERFIDFALLLGTDFSRRIKNVGPNRALKFIREHGSIEEILHREPQYPPRDALALYLRQVELARIVFHTLPPVPDSSTLQNQEPDGAAVEEILRKYGLWKEISQESERSYAQALSGNYFHDDPAVA